MKLNEQGEKAEYFLNKYDWARIEQQNGHSILCGGILPKGEIKAGQKWISSGGLIVEVDKIELFTNQIDLTYEEIHYSWDEPKGRKTHSKLAFSFQCRYCLILEE